jgi:polyhydroxyalkanoate synthase
MPTGGGGTPTTIVPPVQLSNDEREGIHRPVSTPVLEVVIVNTDQMTAAVDAQRRTWEMMAEAVKKADVSAERFVDMMATDVGQTDSELVYEENKLQLRRYEPEEIEHETPIFIVYALVNRPYILDLQPDRSVIRRLLEDGFEVYLIDWGEPSRLDQTLTMDDYVNRYMQNCADVVRERSDVDDYHLLGYCMGGTMSMLYATQYPEEVRTLSLMATPLAFDGTGGILERWANHYDPDTTVEALGNLPAELLAVEFSMMDPVDQYITKYVNLYENIEDEDFVRNFARMEEWIWDGVDVAGEAYREFINDIYKDNQLVNGEYELGDEPIDLSDIEMPAQQIVGKYDHIVPSESSKPFNDLISSEDERLVEFGAGHIGISVSGKAHAELWPDVCEWFAERDASTAEAETAETGTTTDPDVSAGGRISVDSAEATSGHAATVDAVDGIGPTYAERLAGAGIETVADLREHDPEELAEIADTYPSRTENWLENLT